MLRTALSKKVLVDCIFSGTVAIEFEPF